MLSKQHQKEIGDNSENTIKYILEHDPYLQYIIDAIKHVTKNRVMSEFANEDSLRKVFKLLTGKDGIFDEDKQKVINCTESAHIQACPGSGKTTTLLAKLVLLAEQMPLKNGKGICVLTYTNVAIDEIKSKLGHKADILFSYPNFSEQFNLLWMIFASAALQYYYGSRISLIDDGKANDELLKAYRAKGYCQLDRFLYGHNYGSQSILTQEEIDSCGGVDYLLSIKAIKRTEERINISSFGKEGSS